MSGHGKRETRLQADAARWRDRVAIDLTSEYGIVAMKLHHVSIDEIAAAVERIDSAIPRGEGPCRADARRPGPACWCPSR